MEKENIIELTKEVYRITLLFPKKEPLRYKIRETATGILEDCAALDVLNNKDIDRYFGKTESMKMDIVFSLEKGLDILNSYFEVAKWQRWVDYFDVLSIQEKYVRIRELLIRSEAKAEMRQNLNFGFNFQKAEDIALTASIIQEEPQFAKEKKDKKINTRKEKILKVLEKIGRIQVGEVNKIFPEVSKRTLRRDFHKMVEDGMVQRIGEKNNTFYQVNPIK